MYVASTLQVGEDATLGTSSELDKQLNDVDVRALKVDVPEAVRTRLDALKDALSRRGYGPTSNGEIISCLIAGPEVDDDAQVKELFERLQRYRTSTPRDLLRIGDEDASVVPLERKPGRPARRRKTGGD